VAQKSSFELAERDPNVSVQNPPQRRRARAVGPAREHRLDLGWCGAVPNAGLVTRPGQVIDPQHGGQIHERARDGGDRDPAPGRRVFGVDATRPSRPDTLDPALGGRRHFRRGSGTLEDTQQVGSRPPAQESLLATGTHRRQVTRLAARRSVSDAVDPAVLLKQRARAQAMPDLLQGHARAQQLGASNDPVRRSRDSREFLLGCPALMGHCPL
jgi:hypothetical protein